jgi:hypothetical protein
VGQRGSPETRANPSSLQDQICTRPKGEDVKERAGFGTPGGVWHEMTHAVAQPLNASSSADPVTSAVPFSFSVRSHNQRLGEASVIYFLCAPSHAYQLF